MNIQVPSNRGCSFLLEQPSRLLRVKATTFKAKALKVVALWPSASKAKVKDWTYKAIDKTRMSIAKYSSITCQFHVNENKFHAERSK